MLFRSEFVLFHFVWRPPTAPRPHEGVMLACGVGTAAARFDCANMTPPPYTIPAARPISFRPMLPAPEAGPRDREVAGVLLRADDRRRVTVAAIRRRPPEAGAAVQRHARWLRRGGFGFWRRRSDLQFEIGRPLRWCVLFCHDGVLVIVCLQRLL